MLFQSTAYAGGLQNVAVGKPITPITNTILGDPAWVTDGVNDTGAWYSYQGGSYNTNSFTIDLGAQYAIDSVNIYITQAFGYELHSSDNNSDWTLRNEDNFGVSSSVALGPLAGGYSARYFKYWAYTNVSQYIGIIEFQVCTVNDGPDTTICTLAPTYTVGGSVSGLTGSGLVLQNNGGNDLTIGADGGFTFATPLVDLNPYVVTVLTQPSSPSQTCSVNSGSGTLAGENVTDVAVTCVTKPNSVFLDSFEDF